MLFCAFCVSQHFPLYDLNFIYEKADVGLFAVTLVPLLYFFIEPIVGIISFLFYQILYDFSVYLFKMQTHRIVLVNKHFNYSLIGLAFSLIMIFIGHRFFEIRKPNPIANFKTLIFEPAIVVFEILTFLGYQSNIEDWQIIVAEKNIKYLEEESKKTHED
mmetsp:Transcript_19541/g.21845  ORF Transcript_19541/g.21845 Transcript_19541/m.21845 type:complete len:160 (+) Transcript_19541:79-558(+)